VYHRSISCSTAVLSDTNSEPNVAVSMITVVADHVTSDEAVAVVS